jgi:SAM-dependent methyltransferase
MINVLIKDWNFKEDDHCYLESLSNEDSKKYEINDICPLCNIQMETITEVYGNNGSLGLQTGKCSECGYIKHTRNFSQDWYGIHFRDKWLLCDTDRETNVYAKNIPYDKVCHLVNPNSNIADIGCGIGDRLKKFKDNGHNVFGCDPSNHRTEVSSKFLNTEIKAMGGEEFFKFNTTKFDLVYFYTSLHFTENPYHLIKEAAKTLTDDGYIYIVDSKYDYHNLFHAAYLGVARSFMSLKSIDKLATELGMKIIKYEPEPFQVILSKKSTDKKIKLNYFIDIERFIFSELHPKKQQNYLLKLNYQPFNREIKFHITGNGARKDFKNKKISYPIKFISCDYENAPLLLK